MSYAAVQQHARRRSLFGLGTTVSQTDYQICMAQQSAIRAAHDKWLNEKAVRDQMVADRETLIAANQKQYEIDYQTYLTSWSKWDILNKQMLGWAGALAGKYSSYSMAVTSLLKKYPSVKLPNGAPRCVPKTVHDDYVKKCATLSRTFVHGLGADFDWSTYNACFVSQYPVCTADPPRPLDPGPEPQPPTKPVIPPAIPPLRPEPSKPVACSKPTATTAAAPPPPPPPAPIPAPTPKPVVSTAAPSMTPLPSDVTTEAMLPTESRAGGGLLMAGLLAMAVGGGIYLLARKKRPH